MSEGKVSPVMRLRAGKTIAFTGHAWRGGRDDDRAQRRAPSG
jgi:hypothetical protein